MDLVGHTVWYTNSTNEREARFSVLAMATSHAVTTNFTHLIHDLAQGMEVDWSLWKVTA